MTQYFVTYNPIKFQYVVWNNQAVVCRVADDRTDNPKKSVIKFLQEEHDRLKKPIEIFAIQSTSQSTGADLDSIMKAVDDIKKKWGIKMGFEMENEEQDDIKIKFDVEQEKEDFNDIVKEEEDDNVGGYDDDEEE